MPMGAKGVGDTTLGKQEERPKRRRCLRRRRATRHRGGVEVSGQDWISLREKRAWQGR